MRVEVNGEAREVGDDLRLGALVDAEVADRRGVAVAVDGEVVPRARWDEVSVSPGTRVEILAASQGG